MAKQLMKNEKKIIREQNITSIFIFFGGGLIFSLLFALPSMLDSTNVPRFFILSLVLLLTIVLLKKSNKKSLKISRFLALYILFYLFNLLSSFWSLSASEALFESQKYFIGLCVFAFALYFHNHNNNFERSLFISVGFITIIYSAYALIQLLLLNDINMSSLYFISSLNGNKNLFSSFLFLLLAFNIIGVTKLTGTFKFLNVLAIAFSIFFIFFLQTRAVWIAIILSSIILLLLLIKTGSNILQKKMFLIPIAILFIIFISATIIRMSGHWSAFSKRVHYSAIKADSSIQERLQLIKKTLSLIKDHPIIGVGAGNWQFQIGSQPMSGLDTKAQANITFQRPHNDFLWIWSETGTIGFILYLGMIFMILFPGIKKLFDKNGDTNKSELAVYISAYIGFIIVSFFDFPKERMEHIVMSNILMCLIFIKSRNGCEYRDINISIQYYFKNIVIALLLLNVVVGVYRLNGEYNTKKAIDAKSSGQWDNVLTFADKASSVFYTTDPMSMPVAWYIGLSYFHQKKFDNALIELQKAYEISPYNKDVMNDLASAYVKNYQIEKARMLYQEAIRLNSKFESAKINLAILLVNEKHYEEAVEMIESIEENTLNKQFYLKEFSKFIK